MRRAKDGTLVVCLFVVYCVLFSQGLKASAATAFFGAIAAVPLTVHLYRRLWPLPGVNVGVERTSHQRFERDAVEAAHAPEKIDGRTGPTE
jgi:hypothetical protein